MKRDKIIQRLEEDLRHEDYETDFFSKFGLRSVFIGKGTLGPEMSWVSYLLTGFLLKNPGIYEGKQVLDMGCGSGIQAIAVAAKGASFVLAVDISDNAIRSTKENIKKFNLKNVKCVKSHLFRSIKKQKFKVIIFNHPFLKGKPKNRIEGIYKAEEKLIENFFEGLPKYLSADGIIVMAFAHLGGHNPKAFAKKFGYRGIKEKKFKNRFGSQSIYIISKRLFVWNR